VATLEVLAPAGPFPNLFEVAAVPVPTWASLLILGLALLGVAGGGFRCAARASTLSRELPKSTWLALPLVPGVALGVLALGGVPVYFAGRTESLVWAPAVVLALILLARLPRIIRHLLPAAYIAVAAATCWLWLSGLPERPPALGVEVGQRIAPLLEEGDRIVVVGLWQLEVRHGLAAASQGSVSVNPETLPRSQASHPGWLDRSAASIESVFSDSAELEREARAARNRLWLVWSPSLPLEQVFRQSFRGWERVEAATSPVIAVGLLVPPAGVPEQD
jgi:hypothetical protein